MTNPTETICPDPKCKTPACCLRFCDGSSYEPAKTKPARNEIGHVPNDDNDSIELPSPCACGQCGECRNARIMYHALGNRWDGWSDDQIRGALAALELLGRMVARTGERPAYVAEHLNADDYDSEDY